MTEAGVAIGEMQLQNPAMRLQNRLGKWARETFTPQGRAEALAQKYADRVLAQVSEEDREKAMELSEKNRPDLVEAYMPQAKRSLVRDAVIGAVVVGGVGVGVWKRKEIGGLAGKGASKVYEKMSPNVQSAVTQVGAKAGEVRTAVDKFAGGLKGRVAARLDGIRQILRGVKPEDISSDVVDKAIKEGETAAKAAEKAAGLQ